MELRSIRNETDYQEALREIELLFNAVVVVGCVAAGNFPLRRRYSRATHPTFLPPSATPERATPTRLTRTPAATKTRTPPLLRGS